MRVEKHTCTTCRARSLSPLPPQLHLSLWNVVACGTHHIGHRHTLSLGTLQQPAFVLLWHTLAQVTCCVGMPMSTHGWQLCVLEALCAVHGASVGQPKVQAHVWPQFQCCVLCKVGCSTCQTFQPFFSGLACLAGTVVAAIL